MTVKQPAGQLPAMSKITVKCLMPRKCFYMKCNKLAVRIMRQQYRCCFGPLLWLQGVSFQHNHTNRQLTLIKKLIRLMVKIKTIRWGRLLAAGQMDDNVYDAIWQLVRLQTPAITCGGQALGSHVIWWPQNTMCGHVRECVHAGLHPWPQY